MAVAESDTWLWRWARDEPSDIRAHVPLLRWLASVHPIVVEFGVRAGVSTAALLTGRPFRMVSYDLDPAPGWCAPTAALHDVFWTFRQEDVLQAAPTVCDLLFVDTVHTEAQLHAELTRHAGAVRRTIALHDTHIPPPQRNPDHNDPDGMWRAIRRFLDREPAWRVVHDDPADNGLTVLGRLA